MKSSLHNLKSNKRLNEVASAVCSLRSFNLLNGVLMQFSEMNRVIEKECYMYNTSILLQIPEFKIFSKESSVGATIIIFTEMNTLNVYINYMLFISFLPYKLTVCLQRKFVFLRQLHNVKSS